jgi:hypothetical protein
MLLIQHHNIDHVKSGSVDVEGGKRARNDNKIRERERERERERAGQSTKEKERVMIQNQKR